MIKDSPSAWPADVAFKRLVRDLWRQRDYVPPRQTHTGVLLATDPASADTASADSGDGDGPLWSKGGWELDVDDDGAVVLRHETGRTVVLATLEGDGNG